jgi:hypothetical protein
MARLLPDQSSAVQPASFNILRLGAAEGVLIAATVLVVLSPADSGVPPEAGKSFSPILRLLIPYLAVAAGWRLLIKLVSSVGNTDQRVLGALYGSIVLMGLVLARQFIVMQENACTRDAAVGSYRQLDGSLQPPLLNETLGREC